MTTKNSLRSWMQIQIHLARASAVLRSIAFAGVNTERSHGRHSGVDVQGVPAVALAVIFNSGVVVASTLLETDGDGHGVIRCLHVRRNSFRSRGILITVYVVEPEDTRIGD